MTSTYSPETAADRGLAAAEIAAADMQRVFMSLSRHLERMARGHGERLQKHFVEAARIERALGESAAHRTLFEGAREYGRDAAERAWMTLEALASAPTTTFSPRGGRHAAGADYDYEVVVDGRTLPRPVNYMLLDSAAGGRRDDRTGSGPT